MRRFALRADAYLAYWTNVGRDRTTGGEYERPFLLMWLFGPDGRVIRGEQFDLDREADALTRFEELTARPIVKRRVRANAATENAARLDAAVTSHDADAIPTLLSDEMETVEHPTGGDYGREGTLATFRALLRV